MTWLKKASHPPVTLDQWLDGERDVADTITDMDQKNLDLLFIQKVKSRVPSQFVALEQEDEYARDDFEAAESFFGSFERADFMLGDLEELSKDGIFAFLGGEFTKVVFIDPNDLAKIHGGEIA